MAYERITGRNARRGKFYSGGGGGDYNAINYAGANIATAVATIERRVYGNCSGKYFYVLWFWCDRLNKYRYVKRANDSSNFNK